MLDWISKLPDDVLLMILSKLSTEEAIRTSVVSKQWKHVWKEMSHLVFDMPMIIDSTELLDGSNQVATLMTKVINNHCGHLKSCVINHFSHQGVNGMLNTWIQSMTCVKHTKSLTLRHHKVPISKPFNIASDSFSHPSLTSLSLHSYNFESSHPLRNCSNLKTLKLISIIAPEVGVFNKVLTSCPSLKVLVLDIHCKNKGGGPLKIENNKMKLLLVSSMEYIDDIEVSATSLDILLIQDNSVRRDNFILQSPKLQFNKNFWLTEGFGPHISYNITKEKKESLHKKLWEHYNNKDAFPNAKFRVRTVWMYNFSGSDEEFALASCLIKQRAVVNKMMIKTPTSFNLRKMLQVETAVVNKLYALRREYQRKLVIKCL